jgi:hypothetical protein
VNPTPELAAALAAVQAELPPVLKNRTADTGKYTYDYADLADVSAAVLPALGRHGLAFAGFPGHDHDGKFGLRYYLLHSAGGWIDGFFEIDDKGGMQLVGGRITYARRYCLCAVVGVAAEDDVDAREDSGPSRTMRRQQASAQRRTQTSPSAQAATTPDAAGSAPPAGAGGDLPPLPGEEDAPGPGGLVGQNSEAGPGAPAAVTPKQLTAIWTVLSEVFLFGKDERDEARKVCAHIVNRELASSKDMTKQEAATVLDTLAHWEAQAQREDESPRGYLKMMTDATGGEPGE